MTIYEGPLLAQSGHSPEDVRPKSAPTCHMPHRCYSIVSPALRGQNSTRPDLCEEPTDSPQSSGARRGVLVLPAAAESSQFPRQQLAASARQVLRIDQVSSNSGRAKAGEQLNSIDVACGMLARFSDDVLWANGRFAPTVDLHKSSISRIATVANDRVRPTVYHSAIGSRFSRAVRHYR